MRTITSTPLVVAAIVCGLAAVPVPGATRQSQTSDRTADALVAAVTSAKQSTGLRAFAKLTVTTAGSNAPRVQQLRMVSRRSGAAASTRYDVLWPKDQTGQAVVLVEPGDGRLTG